MPEYAEKDCIVVLGSGRCGTSLTMGLLNIMGAEIGRNFIPPTEANPKGFLENPDIVYINERLKIQMGSIFMDDFAPYAEKWWEQNDFSELKAMALNILNTDFGESTLCAIKDPRMSRLLPFWIPIVQEAGFEPKFIINFRAPIEVALSNLEFGRPFQNSFGWWLVRNLEAERYTRGYPRTWISYDSLLTDAKHVMDRISKNLAVSWTTPCCDVVAEKISGLVSPNLRHHDISKQANPSYEEYKDVPEIVKEAYSCMTHAESNNAGPKYAIFDSITRNFHDEMSGFTSSSLIFSILRFREEVVRLNAEINQLTSSYSWRITWPLRLLHHTITKVMRYL